MTMISRRKMLFATCTSALAGLSLISAARAGATDPLFINLISDDGHRINMAFNFGAMQIKRGHPLTIFMNDKALLAASSANAARFTEQQKTMASLMASGAKILVCPMCMKHYGVAETDLLAGLQIGNPELTGNALFADNTKTLTW
jgi:sulfur relay (sulfurtransferase) complex TusBCD TusD component (DsrE family)